MMKITPNSKCFSYFSEPSNTLHRQYDALRRFFVDDRTAEQVALEFGYSIGTVYALVSDFKKKLQDDSQDPFFKVNKAGRKPIYQEGEIEKLVIDCRKNYLSVPDIKITLDSMGLSVSEGFIYEIIHNAGFARLPRRTKTFKDETIAASCAKIQAPIANRSCSGMKLFHLNWPVCSVLCRSFHITASIISSAVLHIPKPVKSIVCPPFCRLSL